MEFTSPIDKYIAVKLNLADYITTSRTLGSEYRICGRETREHIRRREKKLLALYFESWHKPYRSKLYGWHDDSPLYILQKDRLVAGLYLCFENEFNEGESWGQIHYPFMDPSYRGKGIYSVLFREAVKKAKAWDLEGVIINSDRHLLAEVYTRWGAVIWKTIPKKSDSSFFPLRIARRIHRMLIGFHNC
jgi:GNAT superfamily N-acetyltransferase